MSRDQDDAEELRREVARLAEELDGQRAYFAAELAAGAAELDRRDREVARLQETSRAAATARDEARDRLGQYEGSRLVRFAVRVSHALGRMRGRR